MSSAGFAFVTATLLATSVLFNSAAAAKQGSSGRLENDSFEDRINMYSKWAQATQATHGRRLADAPSGSPDPAARTFAAGGYGQCKVLRYHTGFANTTVYYDKIVKDSPNFGECCKSCSADPQCVAWTRVAGGDAPNFRNCYLKYNLDALDDSPAKNLHNHEGHTGDTFNYPELRYVDVDYPSAAVPLILESGTVNDEYPAEYYGCPYAPGNAGKPCDAPVGCNVNGAGVFVAPPCIE